jgi:2-keto-3-deoxy-L-rhamnonate aldolase RhmA
VKDWPQREGAMLGVRLSFLCPELIEVFGLLGFEWLFLDAEHLPLTPAICRDLVRAADLAGMPCMVRVPEVRASIIEGFLDIGVLGVVAPSVSSADEAHALVVAAKFSPEGTRGAAGSTRAADYGLTGSSGEYCRRANRAIRTVALVETERGIAQLDSIMAVPGLDYIAIGTSDLALSLGVESGAHDLRLRSLVDNADARIKAAGKPRLSIVIDAADAQVAARDASLIAVPDVSLIASAGRSFLRAARPADRASQTSV